MAAPDPPPRPLYFINAVTDYALVGGISIVTSVLLYSLYRTGAANEQVIFITSQLAWMCNWPHFAASSYRLYHSRANVRQYPVTALVIPWVVLAGAVGALAYPEVIAPYFVKLFYVWSPYHFSGQTFGITMIYARRAGFKMTDWERKAVSTFVYGTFISQTVRSEVFHPEFGLWPQHNEFWGVRYPVLGLPEWLVPFTTGVMWGGGAVFLLGVARWCLRNRRLLPPIILLPAATQYVWFVVSSHWLSFQSFVPFFHSLQYMLIAWSMQLKEKMDREQIAPSRRYVLAESLRWGLINLAGGWFLFFGLPSWVLPRLGFEPGLSMAVVLSAVQIHHFFVDGVIWKLKSPGVASPLMMNVAELVRRSAPAAAGRA